MDTTTESVRALSYRELQALAKSLNVKATGKREELLERLLGVSENVDACPSTPGSKRVQSDSAKREDHQSPAIPMTPASSLAEALKKLSINTPRAPATPLSHYKTRSVTKSNRPPPPVQQPSCTSTLARPPASDGENIVPRSSSRPSRRAKPGTPARRCTFAVPASIPSSSTHESSQEAPVASSDAHDEQSTSASSNDDAGAPGTEKQGANCDHERPLVTELDAETTMGDVIVETADSIGKAGNAGAEDSVAHPSIAVVTTRLEERASVTEPSAVCMKLFADDAEDRAMAEDSVKGQGNVKTTEEEVLVDETPSVEHSVAFVKLLPGDPEGCVAVGNTVENLDGVTEKGDMERSVNKTPKVESAVSCIKVPANDSEGVIKGEERTGVDSQQKLGIHETVDYDEGDEEEGVCGVSREEEQTEQGREDQKQGLGEEEAEEQKGGGNRKGGEKEITVCDGGEPGVDEVVRPQPPKVDLDTRDLVVASGFLTLVKNDTRVVCGLTGQEIVPHYDDIAQHLDSERVQQLLAERPPPRDPENEEDEVVVPGDGPEIPPPTIDHRTRTLVENSEYLNFTKDEARVVCTLTGQEIKPDHMEILKYLSSKRVQRLLADGPFDVEEYAGMFVVEDPNDANFVLCELTGAKLFKCRKVLTRHLNGIQYKNALDELSTENQSR